jgi:non-ribosomal peptide synthetase component F/aryl carrier-like protein
MARMLPQSAIQRLTVLHCSGEPLLPSDVESWTPHVRLLNTYGPAECTITSTATSEDDLSLHEVTIGTATGCATWIVDPLSERLSAFGAVGELWIEGPTVGEGYLNDPDKSAASFVTDPAWLLHGRPDALGRHGRLYRTGDLVRYTPSGSIIFMGRKDMQIKIRGQRLEKGDVEHFVMQALTRERVTWPYDLQSKDISIFAEIVQPEDSEEPILVAFIHVQQSVLSDDQHDAAIRKATTGLRCQLETLVPDYMIPRAFLPLSTIPLTGSGKTDRRQLHAAASSLTRRRRPETDTHRQEPKSAVEHRLHSLFSQVLRLDGAAFGTEGNFFRIGGDSIVAMRLVGAAREQGLNISALDIFKHPRLSELATFIEDHDRTERKNFAAEAPIRAFSLLSQPVDTIAVRRHVAKLCSTAESEIEDVYPCTPLQEGMLAMTAWQEGSYVAVIKRTLRPGTDAHQFMRAWEYVVASMDILRTRVVDLPGHGLVQVVLRSGASQWSPLPQDHCGDDTDEEQSTGGSPLIMGLGTPLSQVRLESSEKAITFLWNVHHAIYDAWSLALIFEAHEKAYRGASLGKSQIQYQHFLKQVPRPSAPDVRSFWLDEFDGLDAAIFPGIPSSSTKVNPNATCTHTMRFDWHDQEFTMSTAIRTCFAILVSRYTGTPEALFGAVVTGRQVAIPGIESLVAPTVATVPLRIKVDRTMLVGKLMQQIQEQAARMITFEQTGLQYIRKMSETASQACQFQALLDVDVSSGTSHEMSAWEAVAPIDGPQCTEDEDSQLKAFNSYALTLKFEVQRQEVKLHMTFDNSIIPKAQVERLGLQVDYILQQLSMPNALEHSSGNIDIASPHDMQEIWRWNAKVPESKRACVHDLFLEIVAQQPDAPALCAWDGKLTYAELETLSARVASDLEPRLKGNPIVPLVFEKSVMTPVAILGVMRAGGACLLLDTTLPEDRLRTMVNEVNPPFVVSSTQQKDLAARLSKSDVISLDWYSLHPAASASHSSALPAVDPSSTLCVLFTSGSTGIPKAGIVTHENFCSAIEHQQAPQHFSPHDRVADLASYTFDVSWSNLLQTITVGACLCIPSDADRKENPSGVLDQFDVTYAHVTPTVARLVPREQIRRLRVLQCGGEPMTATDVGQWLPLVTLLHTYGPSECTVTSTCAVNDQLIGQERPAIGAAIGCVTWVVDPEAPYMLAAIGAIGELWVEGPIVGEFEWHPRETTRIRQTQGDTANIARWAVRQRLSQQSGQDCSFVCARSALAYQRQRKGPERWRPIQSRR